jgi:hypothetical protein
MDDCAIAGDSSMTTREWSLSLSNHQIRLQHGYWSGRATIAVDGNVIFTRVQLFDLGFVHRFEVDGMPCVVIVEADSFGYRYAFVECAPLYLEEARWLPPLRWGKPALLIAFVAMVGLLIILSF